jgi:hypothetical protein
MWPTWRRDTGALVACVGLALLGLRGARVPLLSLADLGFHELGHLVCYVLDAFLPWPAIVTAAAGSLAQVLVPATLAAYFLLRRADRAAAAVCLAWTATSLADVARYVADAPFEALPLLGGLHDWATILGPDHLDRLDLASSLAAGLDRAAWVVLLSSLVLAAWPLAQSAARSGSAGSTSTFASERPPRV